MPQHTGFIKYLKSSVHVPLKEIYGRVEHIGNRGSDNKRQQKIPEKLQGTRSKFDYALNVHNNLIGNYEQDSRYKQIEDVILSAKKIFEFFKHFDSPIHKNVNEFIIHQYFEIVHIYVIKLIKQ